MTSKKLLLGATYFDLLEALKGQHWLALGSQQKEPSFLRPWYPNADLFPRGHLNMTTKTEVHSEVLQTYIRHFRLL